MNTNDRKANKSMRKRTWRAAVTAAGKKAKLKKYTVRVTGLVVNDVGYGVATCKKPSVSWSVTVR